MVFYRKNKEKKHNSVSYAESYFVFPKNHSQNFKKIIVKLLITFFQQYFRGYSKPKT